MVWRGHDAWRGHPLFRNTVADSFRPGLKGAVAAFAVYLAFTTITGIGSSSSGHHTSHGGGGGSHSHGEAGEWQKQVGVMPSKQQEEDDDDDE